MKGKNKEYFEIEFIQSIFADQSVKLSALNWGFNTLLIKNL